MEEVTRTNLKSYIDKVFKSPSIVKEYKDYILEQLLFEIDKETKRIDSQAINFANAAALEETKRIRSQAINLPNAAAINNLKIIFDEYYNTFRCATSGGISINHLEKLKTIVKSEMSCRKSKEVLEPTKETININYKEFDATAIGRAFYWSLQL